MLLTCGACRKLLRVLWIARRSNHSILKEINPEYPLEGLMLRVKFWYLATLQLIGKDSNAGKDWGQKEKGTTEYEMVGWHHWLNGHEFEQTLGDSEGQGSLACCSPWDCKELDLTWQLNNSNEHMFSYHVCISSRFFCNWFQVSYYGVQKICLIWFQSS